MPGQQAQQIPRDRRHLLRRQVVRRWRLRKGELVHRQEGAVHTQQRVQGLEGAFPAGELRAPQQIDQIEHRQDTQRRRRRHAEVPGEELHVEAKGPDRAEVGDQRRKLDAGIHEPRGDRERDIRADARHAGSHNSQLDRRRRGPQAAHRPRLVQQQTLRGVQSSEGILWVD